ncbi:MAG: hypothetical protein V3T23_06470 [Nitrososphaerales archaeon]
MATLKNLYCPHCNAEEPTLVHRGTKTNPGRPEKLNYSCTECGSATVAPLKQPRVEIVFRTDLPKKRRYVITCAQNATPVNKPFLEALKVYCKHNKAELVVIPIRYKNPTSTFSASQRNEEHWNEALEPYMYEGRDRFNSNVVVLGDVKQQLTAVNPLMGFESMTGALSCIIGHPKLAMKTVPTPHQKLPKIMITTGAVTVKNYTDTRLGKIAAHHHTFGALVLELDGGNFHMRHLNALRSTGRFMDLTKEYSKDGVKDIGPVEALVMGDTHVGKTHPDVVKATFTDKDSIVNILKPKRLVWHDLLDGFAVDPWARNDPFAKVAKRKAGRDDIRKEIQAAVDFVVKYAPKDIENIVVPSNHHDWLERWMDRTDWRFDEVNALFYLETATAMVEYTKVDERGVDKLDPFAYWFKKLVAKQVKLKMPEPDESYMVKGVEIGMHGHLGPHGRRGSPQNLGRIGVKSVIGHAHHPEICEGCYMVGTSTYLRLHYNKGPSGWLNTHAIVYPNGKRQLIHIIDGKWKL